MPPPPDFVLKLHPEYEGSYAPYRELRVALDGYNSG